MTGRPEEKRAEQIVASVTGGEIHTMDVPGAPPRTHDFTVRLPDGRLVAVEVTRHISGSHLGLVKEIRHPTRERSGFAGSWELPGLADSWHLTLSVSPPASIRRLYAEAAGLLNAVPQDAPDLFRPRQDSDLYRLGVRAVLKLPNVRPPQVICAPKEGDFDPTVLNAPTGHLVVQAIEQNIGENAEKLERADADERHLFLWLDFSERRTLADLGFTGTPSVVPSLPASINAVWVAEPMIPGRVLLYRQDQGWTDLGTLAE